MIAYFEEISELANESLEHAKEGSLAIRFVESDRSVPYAKTARLSASTLGTHPEYSVIDNAFGISAWSAILCIDLRQSTWIAREHGPKNMFLTIHTLLPTMIELVKRANGIVAGLRGDGLIAAIGVAKVDESDKEKVVWTSHVAGKAIQDATNCGKAMLETTTDIINPLFAKNGMYGDLSIGVGIDVGPVIITRVGLHDASEVTAYGDAVNFACKLSDGTNQVILSHGAEDVYPSSKGGKMSFLRRGNAYIANFPKDYLQLTQKNNVAKKTKPR